MFIYGCFWKSSIIKDDQVEIIKIIDSDKIESWNVLEHAHVHVDV